MMLDMEALYENDMAFQDYEANDDDDDSDDSDEDTDSDQDDDHGHNDDDGSGASAIANADDDEVDAHKNMLGDVMQKLSDDGIDVDELAERAGIDTSDIDAMGHDDIATLTKYMAQHHANVLENVADRYPAAQGLLGAITGGGGGGLLGKLFG